MKHIFQQLTLEERERIYALREQGKSWRQIGKELHRCHQTVMREYKRNRTYQTKEYIPCKAHAISQTRKREQREKAPLKNIVIYTYVHEKLKQVWSPETIAGRLSKDMPEESICFETIYRYIYGKGKKQGLQKYLVRGHKKRRQSTGRGAHREKPHSRIPNALSIDKRHTKANNRTQAGHWETDLMEGTRATKQVLSVHVERKHRYSVLTKIQNKLAITKQKTLTFHLKKIQSIAKAKKPIVRSVTADNGSENTNHKDISKDLNVPVYFCHPYHSWEKGTEENTIGRIRRYIPKGTPLTGISDEQIQWLENQLNNTPRKCLGFLTPNESLEADVNRYKFRRLLKSKYVGGAFRNRM